jgi:hypothetical protein
MKNEFKELKKENEKIRKAIEERLDLMMSIDKEMAWEFINMLVENELKQEELCNK